MLRPTQKHGRSRIIVALLAGLSLGLAFDVEFPAAPAVVIIAACAGAEAWRAGTSFRDTARLLSVAGAGVAMMLILLMVYNTAAFGAPLQLSYAGVRDFPGMRTGFFGISLPRLDVVAALLFGAYRGLLPLSPVLILVPIAAVVCLRNPGWRFAAVASILSFGWFLCMNAGYFYWDGGYSTGPRHLVPSLPLLALVLPPLWDRTSWRMRATFLLLFAVSVGLSLICASVDMEAPDKIQNPMRDYLLPMFIVGDLPRFLTGLPELPGLLVLAPLLIAWWVLASPIAKAATGSFREKIGVS
jgi:hypothetical protein